MAAETNNFSDDKNISNYSFSSQFDQQCRDYKFLPHLEFTIHLVSRWLIVDDYITTSEGGSLYCTTMCVHSIFEDKRQELIAHTSLVTL